MLARASNQASVDGPGGRLRRRGACLGPAAILLTVIAIAFAVARALSGSGRHPQRSRPRKPTRRRARRRRQRMAGKRTFISFDYDHDDDLRTLLVGQAKHPDTPFEIVDRSVKEAMTG